GGRAPTGSRSPAAPPDSSERSSCDGRIAARARCRRTRALGTTGRPGRNGASPARRNAAPGGRPIPAAGSLGADRRMRFGKAFMNEVLGKRILVTGDTEFLGRHIY